MEGAIIFASLIVGVAVTDQLSSLHRLLRAREKVVWDALPLLYAGFVIISFIMIWWGIAGRSEGAITIGEFLLIFVPLVLMFLLAHATLPDKGDADEYDLKAFWTRQSRYLLGMFILVVALDFGFAMATTLERPADILTYISNRWVDMALLGFMVVVWRANRRWLDWVLVLILCIVPLAWMGRSIGG